MKFELTDDAVLKMSTAMIIAHAVPCVVAPAAQHVSCYLSIAFSSCKPHILKE